MSGRAKADYGNKLVLPGGRWTLDLRRTGATIMVSLGVLPSSGTLLEPHRRKQGEANLSAAQL